MDEVTNDELVIETHEEPQRRRRGLAGWLLSAAFHGALIAIMAGVYWLIETEEPPHAYPPIQVQPPPVVVKPPHPIDPTPSEIPEIATVDPTPDPTPPTDLDPEPPTDSGGEGAIEVSEAPVIEVTDPIGAGVPMRIGSGTGIGIGTGPFDQRRTHRPPRDPWNVDRDPALTSALRWLKRHQGADGSWSAARYQANCTEEPKCEPGDATVGGQVDVALTGYAVLYFLGDGFDHVMPSRFKDTVRKDLAWLVAAQNADGLIGARNYEHAIAAKAIIEAYGMTGDPALKDPAQKAVKVILARQNQDPTGDQAYAALGWDYVEPSDRNDSSVTGWNLMALKSAHASGLDIGHGLEGAKRWLTRAWQAANPGWKTLDPYKDESRFPYTLASASGKIDIAPAPAPGASSADAHDLACVGLMSAAFLGAHAGDAMLETLANDVDAHELPAAYPCNTYKLYYDCLGIYQVGGEKWKCWDERVVKVLAAAQRKDGCFAGSWDFQDTKFHGHPAGRVLSTAYCCLSLEACMLYRRATGAP